MEERYLFVHVYFFSPFSERVIRHGIGEKALGGMEQNVQSIV